MDTESLQSTPSRRDVSTTRIPRRTTSTVQFEVKQPEIKKFDEIAEVIAKIMILGDSGTGKSQIFTRLRKNPYNPNSHPTPGIDFATHIIKISNGKHMRAQIVDNSGLDRYRTIVQNYWSLARGAMVVFDVSSYDSFTAVRSWVRDFKAKACPPGSGRPKPSIMIVGNKMDVGEDRQVSTQDAQSYATANGFFYTETSAKDDVNVDIAFNVLLTDVYFEMMKDKKKTEDDNKSTLKPEDGGFVETTIAKLGRTLTGKRKNTVNLGERSSSPMPDEGRLSPFPSRPGTPNPGAFRRGSTLLGPPQTQSPSAPTLDEQIISGAKTLWKWVGEVVDDLVDEIEGVVRDDSEEDYIAPQERPFQFPAPSQSYSNPMVGIVTPPTRQSRGSRSGSDSGSYVGYETDDSDEGQMVVDFLRGRSTTTSIRRPYIPPRSDSSHNSGSPPLSPISSTGAPAALLSPSRGKIVILPRKASLAPGMIPIPHPPNHGDSLHCGTTDILSETSTSDLNDDLTIDSKTEVPVKSSPRVANAPNLVVEVSTLTPIGKGDSNLGARSLLPDDHFAPSAFLENPRMALDSMGSSSDTFIDLGDEIPLKRKQPAVSRTIGHAVVSTK